jgi:hypothetical protein
MKPLFVILLSLVVSFSSVAAAEPRISDFRLKHGEGHVTIDATFNRIALEQAKAMAAKDTLDHEVLGSFSSGSYQRDRGGLRKTLRMAMTVSKKRSINELPQRGTEKISCSTTRLASASPA